MPQSIPILDVLNDYLNATDHNMNILLEFSIVVHRFSYLRHFIELLNNRAIQSASFRVQGLLDLENSDLRISNFKLKIKPCLWLHILMFEITTLILIFLHNLGAA